MTLWAMLMVEFVHPLMQQMFRDGTAFQDCPECADWASSVMKATFLLFKTAPGLKICHVRQNRWVLTIILRKCTSTQKNNQICIYIYIYIELICLFICCLIDCIYFYYNHICYI